jgi:hypothetical protein
MISGSSLPALFEYPETKATLGGLLGDKMAWVLRVFAG